MAKEEQKSVSDPRFTPVDEERDLSSGRRKRGLTASWRVTVSTGVTIAIFILLINISILIWVKTSFVEVDGTRTIFEGSCETTKTAIQWTALAINILSTLLLAASNNCAQLLSSPTRKDLDRAHTKGSWMDVGVPSFRNLRKIAGWRIVLWALLMMSSIPLHLVYNSVIFDTLSANLYRAVLVTEDFVNGGDWHYHHLLGYATFMPLMVPYLQEHVKDLQKLDKADCIRTYASRKFQTQWGSVLVVTSLKSNNSLLAAWDEGPGSPDLRWVCPYEELWNCHHAIDEAATWSVTKAAQCDVIRAWWDPANPCPAVDAPVEYCLAQRTKPHCTVRVSVTNLWIVIACNTLKVICLTTVVLSNNFEPLATIGDAGSSFLETPEPLTANTGTLSSALVKHKQWTAMCLAGKVEKYPFQRRPRRWGQVISWQHWTFYIFGCTALLAPAIYSIFASLDSTARDGASFSELWHLGIGGVDPNHRVSLPPGVPHSLFTNVLFANLPQLAISCLCVVYNSIFTSMVLAHEFTKFAAVRKSLRVSQPRGQQRSTFWLQLPYRYILPILLRMAVLHWLVSRSIFLMWVTAFNNTDISRPNNDFWGAFSCSFNVVAIIFAVSLGGVMALGLVGFSFRSLDSGMPIVGSSSLAVNAAAYHGAAQTDAALKPLMYGVLLDHEGSGCRTEHVGLSRYEVVPLVDGVIYS